MADWYAFKDPRQFYYGAYTWPAPSSRTAESNFDFVEGRGLAATLPDACATPCSSCWCRCATWPGAPT
jgi:phenol hydroxylase P1 protein